MSKFSRATARTVILNGHEQRIEGCPTYDDLVELAMGVRAHGGYVVTHRQLPTHSGPVRSVRLMPGEVLPLVDGMVISVVKIGDRGE